MCEVESIINSRPITTISNDPNDLEPLTPKHLLLLKSPMALPPGVFNPQDYYSRKQWRQVQYLANVFWSRWIKEFLPLLQKRQKWCQTKNNLSVNDVVLVVDKALPRGAWCVSLKSTPILTAWSVRLECELNIQLFCDLLANYA